MPKFADENEEKSFYDQSGDDRTVAFRLAKIVEDRLTGALQIAIPPNEALADLLFKPHAPLGSFEAKILAAYAVTLIGEDVFKDLAIVSQILRAFDDVGATFDSAPIANHIESLKALDVHRQIHRTKANSAENASRADRLLAFILEGELENRKSQFKLCMRFYLNLLTSNPPSAAPKTRGDGEATGTAGGAEAERHFVSKYYENVRAFEVIVGKATRISYHSGGRQASGKQWWAASLFTRLCVISGSILVLTPGSSFASEKLDHWDFGSVASLVRNLIECYLTFFYLCIEEVIEAEWKARITVMHLRDNVSRLQMFRALDPKMESAGHDAHTADLHNRLRNNSFFMAMPESQRKRFLKGDSALLLSQDEIVTRMGDDVSTFRGTYKFLSAQVHSTPMAFYRTGEHDRGRGVESAVEKGYIAMALALAGKYVLRAARDMVGVFPDLGPLLGDTHAETAPGDDGST